MKIIAIDIKNHKKISVFNARPEGDNLVVAGDTGTGKTTAISALWSIINKDDDAIRHGEEKAQIRVKLSDGSKTLICERDYTPKTSTITIMDSEEGKVLVSDLKKMLSDLSMNPHEIADMGPTERTNTLLNSLGIEKQLDMIDEELEEAKEHRKYMKRKLSEKNPGEEPEKAEEVNIQDKIAELEEAQEHNKEIEEAEDMVQEFKLDIEEYKEEIRKLKDAIKECEKHIDGLKDTASKKPIDTAGIKREIRDAEEQNKQARQYELWKKEKEEFGQIEEAVKEAKERVSALRKQKSEIVEKAEFPLPGLTVEDGNITYNGVLFENLGHSEQMKVCCALAKEQIGKIRVVRMDGIESMSKEDFEEVEKMFSDADIQVLATRVSRGDTEPDEIVIREGVYTEESKNE